MKRMAIFLFTLCALCIFTIHTSHAATVGTSGAVYGPSTLYTGLVGWWTFDGKNTHWTSSTAATTDDVSGNGNAGTLSGMNISTSTAQGKIGQALQFNGLSSQVNLGSNSSLNITGAITLSAWVRPTVDQRADIIRRYNDSSAANSQYGLIFDTSNGGRFAFDISDGTNQSQLFNTFAFTVTYGQWYHIVATWDGTTNAGSIKLYINGQLNSSLQSTATSIQSVSTSAFIGSDGLNNRNYFNGTIDDVRIYNRALSASEIQQLYNDTAGNRVATSQTAAAPGSSLTQGLVGYWTFDGKNTHWTSRTAATTDDVSGNGNTGTFSRAHKPPGVSPWDGCAPLVLASMLEFPHGIPSRKPLRIPLRILPHHNDQIPS